MVYVRTPAPYSALGQPPAGRSRVCAAADRASAAHDTASAELLRQLRLPITAEQTAQQARRADELRRLFGGLDGPTARRLAGRLNDRADPLGQFFDCELSTPLRSELRSRLVRPPAPAAVPPPVPMQPGPEPWIPGVPAPVPPVWPFRPPVPPPFPPGQRVPPPREIFEFPRDTGPGISVKDLLHRARQVLDLAVAAGVTGAAVVALGTALAEAGKLAGLIGGSGVGTALLFDALKGKLSLAPFPPGTDPHYLVLRARAAALARPEWGQLEERLRELARLADVVREQARDPQGRWQKRQPGDSPPGAPFADSVCDRVRRNFPFSAREVHVRPYLFPSQPGPRRSMGNRVIIDCVGSFLADRGLRLFEAKSGGGLRRNQPFEYPRLARNGGVIVSDRGPYRAGQELPIGTAVTLVTPANIDFVLPLP
ncbi:hypothetical protein [Streptomyces kanamyceticus]|uniref:hypothetical protein n=1 Tax=Streptomyces kanamyceticus TaxID=1967 RepID=UPI0006E32BCA|nr:hypothetical protein [Streptomyces kanamyceticus]